jgi:Pentapeptide repeats (8 copies)
MDQPESAPMVDVQKVDIDHVNVMGTGKSTTAQTWVALTPLLTVLITAIGIVFTFCFQLVQTRTASLQKVDSDWRAALEKVSVDEESAAIGAFEMQSFLADPKYGDQARAIAAAVLPTVANRYEFDAAFFVLLGKTNQKNQADIITIATSISNRLMDLHSTALLYLKEKPEPKDKSLENFVLNPDQFFSDSSQSSYLLRTQTEAWKLDSVIGGLSTIWRGGNGNGPILVPDGADLSGIIFLNHNFQGVDFTHASLANAYFIGDCTVDANSLPKDARPPECAQK